MQLCHLLKCYFAGGSHRGLFATQNLASLVLRDEPQIILDFLVEPTFQQVRDVGEEGIK